jgi:hypothetical protein
VEGNWAAPLAIHPSERVAFVGKTQSGKTHVAGVLLLPVRRAIVVDAKGYLSDEARARGDKNGPLFSWHLTEWDSREGAKVRKEMERGGPGRLRCPAPISGDFEGLFRWAYHLEDVCVYLDELYGVTEGPRPGKWLRALYTRGAERRIGVWVAFQRPRDIPKIALTEAEWRFMFQLPDPDDREFMRRQMGGDEAVLEPLDERQFYLYQNGWDYARYYSQISTNRRLA